MFQWLKENKFNICFLQELHCNADVDNTPWGNQWGGDLFLSGNSSNSLGIGIFIKKDLDFKYNILEYEEIIIGRLQLLKIEIQGKLIVLFNIYGPNTDNTDFLTLWIYIYRNIMIIH